MPARPSVSSACTVDQAAVTIFRKAGAVGGLGGKSEPRREVAVHRTDCRGYGRKAPSSHLGSCSSRQAQRPPPSRVLKSISQFSGAKPWCSSARRPGRPTPVRTAGQVPDVARAGQAAASSPVPLPCRLQRTRQRRRARGGLAVAGTVKRQHGSVRRAGLLLVKPTDRRGKSKALSSCCCVVKNSDRRSKISAAVARPCRSARVCSVGVSRVPIYHVWSRRSRCLPDSSAFFGGAPTPGRA